MSQYKTDGREGLKYVDNDICRIKLQNIMIEKNAQSGEHKAERQLDITTIRRSAERQN